MEFELTPEQRRVRDLVREFAAQEIAPGAGERDEREELPLDIVKKLGELGICGVPIPEEYGGLGADAVTWALVIEELGRADASVAVTVSVASGLAGGMLVRYGTHEQRQRWLPPIAAGEMLASFGLTEPGSGSDAAALRTKARSDGVSTGAVASTEAAQPLANATSNGATSARITPTPPRVSSSFRRSSSCRRSAAPARRGSAASAVFASAAPSPA